MLIFYFLCIPTSLSSTADFGEQQCTTPPHCFKELKSSRQSAVSSANGLLLRSISHPSVCFEGKTNLRQGAWHCEKSPLQTQHRRFLAQTRISRERKHCPEMLPLQKGALGQVREMLRGPWGLTQEEGRRGPSGSTGSAATAGWLLPIPHYCRLLLLDRNEMASPFPHKGEGNESLRTKLGEGG